MKIHRFLLVAVLALVLVLTMAAPAFADIEDTQWSGATYAGWDDFYDDNVAAFTAGSTASLAVLVENDRGCDIDIKGAKIVIDGIGEFTTTDFPDSIANGESDFINFSFTVPSDASNQTTYNPTVHVRYDEKDDDKQGEQRTNDWLAEGDGVTTVFYGFGNTPIIEDSLTVEVDGTATTAYTIDLETGKITFTTAPEDGDDIIATEYRYYREWTRVIWDTFAVYSSDQAGAQDLIQQLNTLGPGTYAGWAGNAGIPTEARNLMAQATEEATLGDQEYAKGNFADAETHLQEASDLMDQAIAADSNLIKEDANVNIPSVALWLGGIGLLILGLGMGVFALKGKS